MVIEQKRLTETIEETLNRRKKDLEKASETMNEIEKHMELIGKAMKIRDPNESRTPEQVIQDLKKVIEANNILYTAQLREVLECLWKCLTV